MKKLIAIASLLFFLSPILASAALYKSSDGKVWADWNGKRRWIRTAEIFNSYGYQWSDVKDIADLSLSRKPINNLVRIKDKPEVYALSDSGYKRHIHNPDIFNSYNLSWEDVADINETELAGYPDCNLIKEANNEKVYKLDGNTLYPIKDLATFNYYGFSWNALQIINSEDLATYIIGSELAYTAPAGSPSPSPVWSPTPTPTPTPTQPSATVDPSLAKKNELKVQLANLQSQIDVATASYNSYTDLIRQLPEGELQICTNQAMGYPFQYCDDSAKTLISEWRSASNKMADLQSQYNKIYAELVNLSVMN